MRSGWAALFAAVVCAIAVHALAPRALAIDWYIKGETGSDVNSGHSPSEPRRTFPPNEEIAAGDIFHVSERCRSRLYVTGFKSNITVQQWAGQPQGEIRGDVPLTLGWERVGATDAFELQIPPNMGLNNSGLPNNAGWPYTGSVVHNWDVNIDALGRHYGHMSYDARAVVVSAAGEGKYHYSAATGMLTVNLGGPSPLDPGEEVAFCDAENKHAIQIEGGSGHVVRGLVFSLFPTSAGGYGVIYSYCTNSRVESCVARDMGVHAFGATMLAGNITFKDCFAAGLVPWGTHFVWHTSGPPLEGCVAVNCRAVAYRHRNFDNSGVPAGADAMSQFGFFTHGPGFGNAVRDVLVDGCSFDQLEAGGTFVGGDQLRAPEAPDYFTWSAYPLRVRGGRVTGGDVLRHWDWVAYSGTRFELPYTGERYSGFGNLGGIFLGSSGNLLRPRRLLFESCEFIVNLDGPEPESPPTRLFAVSLGNPDDQILRVNCSILNTGTQTGPEARAINDWAGRVDTPFVVRGEVVEYSVPSDANVLCIEDGTLPANRHDMLDGVYKNVHRFSHNQSLDEGSEWFANVDTIGGHTETGVVFPQAPAVLALSPASVIWNDQRATTAIVPASGLNGPYTGFYGAYQYPPVCYADCDGSGAPTIADFGCFQTRFVQGDPQADCNQSGGLTIADFACFQSKFVAGCP